MPPGPFPGESIGLPVVALAEPCPRTLEGGLAVLVGLGGAGAGETVWRCGLALCDGARLGAWVAGVAAEVGAGGDVRRTCGGRCGARVWSWPDTTG